MMAGSHGSLSEEWGEGMPWYWIALIVCLVIGPFDALYLYIKAQKRRDRLRGEKREEDKREA